jgi:hypothetical protein
MRWPITFLLVAGSLTFLRLGPAPDDKDVEIAVLRHQLAVLRRQVARPRYSPTGRAVLAPFARLLGRERWAVFLVTPATLLRGHRELGARSWTYPRRGLAAPNALENDVVALVVRLAREGPRWGYLRTVGGCGKLGVAVSATSVRNVLCRHRLRPAPRQGLLGSLAYSGGGKTGSWRAGVICLPLTLPRLQSGTTPAGPSRRVLRVSLLGCRTHAMYPTLPPWPCRRRQIDTSSKGAQL